MKRETYGGVDIPVGAVNDSGSPLSSKKSRQIRVNTEEMTGKITTPASKSSEHASAKAPNGEIRICDSFN
jgi:hypothetical protein